MIKQGDTKSNDTKTGDILAKKGIFLGRAGKVFGPFQQDEYDRMFAEGKLSEYSWLWDWKAQVWKPMEAPPAPPTALTKETGFGWGKVRAICFDRFGLVSGKLECVTESGCEFVSKDGRDGMALSLMSHVELRLHDTASKKNAIVAPVMIANICHRDDSRIYRLKWKGVPSFM